MNHSIKTFIETHKFQYFIAGLILINSTVLGLETYPPLFERYGKFFDFIDRGILWIFVIELTLQMFVYRKNFFKDPWHLFDLFVISISFIPANEAFAVLRTLRILRVLRLISVFPSLRRVVHGLISAIPGISSIATVLLILFYVFAVISTTLFGQSFPDFFGSLQASLFSLFQIMTLEGWPDIVRGVMKVYPLAWIFFIVYILIATFSVLNLFIAVIVDAMQKAQDDEQKNIETQLYNIDKNLNELKNFVMSLKK